MGSNCFEEKNREFKVRKDFGVGIKREKLRERDIYIYIFIILRKLITLRETHKQNTKVIINR